MSCLVAVLITANCIPKNKENGSGKTHSFLNHLDKPVCTAEPLPLSTSPTPGCKLGKGYRQQSQSNLDSCLGGNMFQDRTTESKGEP